MNEWKISSSCKCNNFAINKTRKMSGNFYVPVTLSICCWYSLFLLFPNMSHFNKINTFATNHAIKLYCHRHHTVYQMEFFVRWSSFSDNAVRCGAMEFQIRGFSSHFVFHVFYYSLGTCVLLLFHQIKQELN